MSRLRVGIFAWLLAGSVAACSRGPVKKAGGAAGFAGGSSGITGSGGAAGAGITGSGGAGGAGITGSGGAAGAGITGSGGAAGAGITGSGGGGAGITGSGGGGGAGVAGSLGGGGAGVAGSLGTGGAGTAGNGGTAGSTVACAPLAPITRRLWPLAPAQFGNATRDLLSLAAAPSVAAPGSTPAPPLASTLLIDGTYLFALYQTAGMIATEMAPRAAGLAACEAGETDADCATRFARTFGRKAFRRALDGGEISDVMKVFMTVCPGPSTGCASPADFGTAINLMIKAFILAPSFLYRTELGPRSLTANAAGRYPDTTLTADEVATQLAFLLLGSTPDAGLTAAAESGALDTPTGIMSEVNRLLALPAAQTNVTAMVGQWLGITHLADATKDPTFLSPLTASERDQAAIAAELRTSWDRSIAATLWSSPPHQVADLLTVQTLFANPRLATLYGLQPAATSNATFTETAWPAAQPRAGILTHPAFLWAASGISNANIVMRGKAIHDAVVCADALGPEPVLTTPEALAVIQMGDSETTRSDARLASGNLCATSCHSEIDPYGRLLHAFDAIGNYRTVDEAGRPIDTSVTLTASAPLGPMTFSGPVAFANALVSSKVFAGCAMQRLFEAAIDVRVPVPNTCQVNDLRAAFDQSDGTMASLIRQIAVSDFARARAGGTQ